MLVGMPDDNDLPAVPVPPQIETNVVRSIPFAPSTQIADVQYDEGTMTMTISFQRGGIYEYYNVPSGVADGFRDAPSAGRYLSTYIKGVFDYQKVG
jgi:hypothetical protein